MCINVTILNLNAVKVTVQTNLNEQSIGFTNVVSYFFLLILGWNTTQTCIWQVLWGWPLRLSDISISDSPLLRMVDSTHSQAVFFLFGWCWHGNFCWLASFQMWSRLQAAVAMWFMDDYTLKNKGASQCHRRTFLSKWLHKEPLYIWRTFISQKVLCGERRFFRL